MKVGRIRTEWGSLILAQDGSVVLCVQCDGAPCCICFGSLQELRQAIDGRRISVKKWAIALPRSLCILKPVTLPASDLAEAVKMVEFELPSLVPLSLDEIVYGCMLINKKDNMLNVLVCILKLNALDQHLEPYRAVGIEPHMIGLDSLAMQNWFSTVNGWESGSALSAVVDGRHCVVLTSVDNRLHKVKELTLSGADACTVSREVVGEILRQREELPTSARDESRTLLAGRQEYLSEMCRSLGSISAGPAAADSVRVVANPEVTQYHDADVQENSDIFAYEAVVTTGLLDLARSSKLPFSNLLPQKHLKKLRQRALLFSYVFTAAASVMLIVSVWLCLWALNYRIECKSRKIELEIAPIASIASDVDKKRQRVRAIQSQLSDRGLIVQLFEDLYKYTPPNISISKLSFSRRQGGTVVDIKGRGDSLANAMEYPDSMREAVLLNEMQSGGSRVVVRGGGSVAEFKARCIIKRN